MLMDRRRTPEPEPYAVDPEPGAYDPEPGALEPEHGVVAITGGSGGPTATGATDEDVASWTAGSEQLRAWGMAEPVADAVADPRTGSAAERDAPTPDDPAVEPPADLAQHPASVYEPAPAPTDTPVQEPVREPAREHIREPDPEQAPADDADDAYRTGGTPVVPPGTPAPRASRRRRRWWGNSSVIAASIAGLLVAGAIAGIIVGERGGHQQAMGVGAESSRMVGSASVSASPAPSASAHHRADAGKKEALRAAKESPHRSGTTEPTASPKPGTDTRHDPRPPAVGAAPGPSHSSRPPSEAQQPQAHGHVQLCVQGSADFRGYVKLEGTTYDGSTREYTLGSDGSGNPVRTTPGACDTIPEVAGGHYQVYLFYIDSQHVGHLVTAPFEWASTMSGGQSRNTVWELTGNLPQPGFRLACDSTGSCAGSTG
jgi:hypothetical protein